jgi:hypothetical protein
LATIFSQIFYLLGFCGYVAGTETVVGYEEGFSTEASKRHRTSMTDRVAMAWSEKISFSQPSAEKIKRPNYQAPMPKRGLLPKGPSGAPLSIRTLKQRPSGAWIGTLKFR